MMKKLSAACAALALAATSSQAASPDRPDDLLASRAGIIAGPYLFLSFTGNRSAKAQLGLRVGRIQDYRYSSSRSTKHTATLFDMRFVGDATPTLYVAGSPASGSQPGTSKRTGNALKTVAILALTAVGALVVVSALDDDDKDLCLLPEGCP